MEVVDEWTTGKGQRESTYVEEVTSSVEGFDVTSSPQPDDNMTSGWSVDQLIDGMRLTQLMED